MEYTEEQITALGFSWDSRVVPVSREGSDRHRACFRVKKLLPEFIWNITTLEDNPYTFLEVKTLLDGITVGGHSLSDQQQVLNQTESWKYVLKAVETRQVSLDKTFFCTLNALVAKEEGLTWGIFRDGPVSIAGTEYAPAPSNQLDAIFEHGLTYLHTLPLLERGLAFFLFGAMHQFFYDGNKRTARLLMNGLLLGQGWDAVNIPAKRKQEFNEKMLRFYDTKDGTEMFEFLLSC